MAGRWMRIVGAVVAFALGACGSSGDGAGRGPVSGDPGTGGDPGGGGVPARCEEVTIWIRGASQGPVSALGLVVGDVAVSRDGSALPILDAALGTTLGLSSDALALAVGRFALADGDADLSVSVSFSGGSAVRDGLEDELDLRCTGPVAFRFRPARLSTARCHAVVVLNVGRTVVPYDGGLGFVPHYQVFF